MKHDVVAGRCGSALFKIACLDDVCPILWGIEVQGSPQQGYPADNAEK